MKCFKNTSWRYLVKKILRIVVGFFEGILGSSLNKIKDNEISNYLKEFNYSIYAKSVNTVTFIENNFLEEREK